MTGREKATSLNLIGKRFTRRVLYGTVSERKSRAPTRGYLFALTRLGG